MNRIAVLDLETDPFEYGQMIYPFCAGFYDGEKFIDYWGNDCVAKLVAMLQALPYPLIIYAHNGGRFDYFYFLKYLEAALRIVNGRIIQAWLGHHELRDSYAIMPFPLETYKKTPIDYALFKRGIREQHREQIVSYLRDDCTDLHLLCSEFLREFGDNLTIGSASMKQLKKFHSFACGNEIYDDRLRKKFYFGGRNQVFRSGIIHDTINVYDVNSMYPKVMRDFLHPVSTGIYEGTKIDARTAFVSVLGRNFGAFPRRTRAGSLDFTCPDGTFHCSIHEYEAALETGTFQTDRVIRTYGYTERHNFDDFVTHFYDARVAADQRGDKIRKIFYKFVMNSSYGKFAQNPENYADWFICEVGSYPKEWHECGKCCSDPCRLRWTPSFLCENYIIWKRPLKELTWYNVATGASITGAARAVLLRGLSKAENPLYCDTDSIICKNLPGVSLSGTELGAWKLEATGTKAAICGKKLYAIFDGSGTCIKKAHKGVRLEGSDIIRIAMGATVEACNPVPNFRWDGTHTFTKRKVRATA